MGYYIFHLRPDGKGALEKSPELTSEELERAIEESKEGVPDYPRCFGYCVDSKHK